MLTTVGRGPVRIADADFDGDGNPDVATANANAGSVSVLLGRGDGSFRRHRDYAAPGGAWDIAAADLNGDGRPDVVAAGDEHGGSVSVLINRGAGRLARARTYPAGAPTVAVAVADVDDDGLPDVLAGTLTRRRNLSVLLGVGGGHLAPARRFGGGTGGVLDLGVGDLDGDGAIDLVAATALRGNDVEVRIGSGDGTFGPPRPYAAGRDPDGVALADLNRDGRLDLLDTDSQDGTVSIFLGNGDGTFLPRRHRFMTLNPETVLAADFNGDSVADLVTSSAFDGAVPVATGRGDGTFGPARTWGWGDVQGGAVADFDRDGRLDLAFADTGIAAADVFLNWAGGDAPPCVVLDVTRYPMPKAARYIGYGGCRVGRVTRRPSRRVPRGRVMAQRPRRARCCRVTVASI